MTKKKALIYDITGQEGICLAKYLIKKRYAVHGICEHKKLKNIKKLDSLEKIKIYILLKFTEKKLVNLLKKNFDEIYFLSEQTSAKNSEIYNYEITPIKVILDFIVTQKGKKSKHS